MSRVEDSNVITRGLIVCAIAGMLVLCSQIASWATSACQVPNPSTKYCTALSKGWVNDCSANNGSAFLCGDQKQQIRNQFPDGSASSKSGTTKEESADCWRGQTCAYDADTSTCKASGAPGTWQPADKTVTGTATCPTTED